MNNLLDQNTPAVNNSKVFKLLSGILIILVLISPFLIIIKMKYDKGSTSPWLPEYMFVAMNGALINLCCFALFGVIPATFFWFRKKYLIAFVVLLIFIIVGIFLKDQVTFYEYFF